jgi:hypothetical protein
MLAERDTIFCVSRSDSPASVTAEPDEDCRNKRKETQKPTQRPNREILRLRY